MAPSVGLLVDHDLFGQTLHIEGNLGDEGAIHTRQVGGDERGLAGVAAEEFDDADPFVGAGAGPEIVDEIDAPGHRRGEADAVVGAVDVVVHCLGNRHHRKPFAVEPFGVAEGVVAADGYEGVDPHVLQVGEDVLSEIVLAGGFRIVLRSAEEFRDLGVGDLAGVGAARVEEGAAGTVHGAHRRLVEGDDVLAL